jgi:hypothetical protein
MWSRRVRFSLGTLMMIILALASCSALFVKVRQYATTNLSTPGAATWVTDAPTLCILATVLTAVALAAWKGHTLALGSLQVTLACLGWLALIWVAEAGFERAVRYWFEATFALAVALPLVVRHAVKTSLPRGPRRDWGKKACEAVFFSALNMLLVSAGAFLQGVVFMFVLGVLNQPAPPVPAQGGMNAPAVGPRATVPENPGEGEPGIPP